MSVFGDMVENAMESVLEPTHGRSITVVHNDDSTDVVTGLQVEDVGALDPVLNRTYSIRKELFVNADPDNGEQATIDGSLWHIVKIRDTDDGTYEIRFMAAEEIT